MNIADCSNNKRLNFFDTAKGIAILFVIYGHSGAGTNFAPPIFKLMFSFYMPLFFVISGYFFKPRGIKETIIKSSKSLLLAYFVSGFVGTFLAYIIGMIPDIKPFDEIERYAISIFVGPVGYYGGTSTLVLWFFVSLFWGRIILEILYRFLNYWQVLTLSILVFILSQWVTCHFVFIEPWFWVIYGINCLVFLCVGITCRRINIFNYKIPFYLLLILFFAIYFNIPTIYMPGCSYEGYFSDIVMASLLSVAMLFICKSLNVCNNKVVKFIIQQLNRIGRHTLLLYSIECVLFIGHFSQLCYVLIKDVPFHFGIIWDIWHFLPRIILIISVAVVAIRIKTQISKI